MALSKPILREGTPVSLISIEELGSKTAEGAGPIDFVLANDIKVGGVIVAVAGVALAANFTSSKQADFFAAGRHQFYVWCAGGSDFMAMQSGASAADAQMKLYNDEKRAGKTNCWPVWQGRVSG